MSLLPYSTSSLLFLTSHHYELTIKCCQERIKGQRAPSHALDWYQVPLWLLLGHVTFTEVIFSPIKRLKLIRIWCPERSANFYSVFSRGNSKKKKKIFCIVCFEAVAQGTMSLVFNINNRKNERTSQEFPFGANGHEEEKQHFVFVDF